MTTNTDIKTNFNAEAMLELLCIQYVIQDRLLRQSKAAGAPHNSYGMVAQFARLETLEEAINYMIDPTYFDDIVDPDIYWAKAVSGNYVYQDETGNWYPY